MDSIIILIYVYMFLIGMCVASFMNVVIDRVPRNESFVKGRSHCDHCGETLKWYDLVPIVSYIFLRGKCRYCHTSIPIRGFLIEIFGGLIGMFCFYRFGFSIETILMFVIALIIIIAGVFMETSSAIIILTPVFLPLVQGLGVDLVHFGILFVVGIAIGMITPPVAINLFVASGITGKPIELIAKAVIPYLLGLLIVFLLIVYVPLVVPGVII